MTVHEAFLIAVLKCRRVLGWKWTRGMLDDVNHRLAMDVPDSVHIIYIYIFKRLRATAGQGPNYVGPFCGYVGLCWPILRAMWAQRGAMLAQLGAMLTHVEPKDPKNRNSKKNTVKRRIFWWSAAYLGAMLAHLGAMLAYLEGNVGPSWGYVDPSWGYVGPSWGYVAPSWGYVGRSWGLCWSILTHLEEKWEEHKTL